MVLSPQSNRRDVTHLAAPRRPSQIMFTPSALILFADMFSADMALLSEDVGDVDISGCHRSTGGDSIGLCVIGLLTCTWGGQQQ
jgi:hypothetical protein